MNKLIAQADFGGGLQPPITNDYTEGVTEGTTALSSIELFISNMVGVLTTVASIFFIIYFVMGAFKWVTAGGDSGKVQKARDQMIQSVLGLVLIVAAYAIIGVIGSIIGLQILQPAAILGDLLP